MTSVRQTFRLRQTAITLQPAISRSSSCSVGMRRFSDPPMGGVLDRSVESRAAAARTRSPWGRRHACRGQPTVQRIALRRDRVEGGVMFVNSTSCGGGERDCAFPWHQQLHNRCKRDWRGSTEDIGTRDFPGITNSVPASPAAGQSRAGNIYNVYIQAPAPVKKSRSRCSSPRHSRAAKPILWCCKRWDSVSVVKRRPASPMSSLSSMQATASSASTSRPWRIGRRRS